MRRLIIVALAASLIFTALPASANDDTSRPGVDASGDQLAWGDWIVGKGDRPDWYVGVGVRFVDLSGYAMNLGIVGKGSCTVKKGKHGSFTSCFASGQGREIPMEDFVFDPLMNSSSMTLTAGKYTHRVDWEGRNEPFVSQSTGGGSSFTYLSASASRNALPTGELFGKKLSKKTTRSSDGFLFQGASAAFYTRSITYDPDTERFKVTAKFRLPR